MPVPYLNELFALHKAGKITYSMYKSLTAKSPAQQKAAIAKANAKGGNLRGTKINKLSRQVKDINYTLKHDMAKHTNRRRATGGSSSLHNDETILNLVPISGGSIKTAIANLRYYDPSAPGTLVTANAATGTYSRHITIKNIHSTLRIRNNYHVPMRFEMASFTPRGGTNVNCITAVANSKADNFVGGPIGNPTNLFFSDYEQLKKLYKKEKSSGLRTMNPGSTYEMSFNTGKFDFDPSVFADDPESFQSRFKSLQWLVRHFGELAHDSVNLGTEVGYSGSSLDFEILTNVEIEYDAGTSLNDISVDSNVSTFTTSAVCANKPSVVVQAL